MEEIINLIHTYGSARYAQGDYNPSEYEGTMKYRELDYDEEVAKENLIKAISKKIENPKAQILASMEE